MRTLFWSTAPAWLLLAVSGCCIGPTVDTVPWWKGLPCLVIEPSSLEAMVWRDHLRARRASRAVCLDAGLPADGEWLESVPADAHGAGTGQRLIPAAPEVGLPAGAPEQLSPVPMSFENLEPFRAKPVVARTGLAAGDP